MPPRDGAAEIRRLVAAAPEMTERDTWPEPDMEVLRLRRRPPPKLPIEVFGPAWRPWIATAAEAAACPPDYVVAPLLTSVSALIGHARWAQATPGWTEPPHLWIGAVGDSGNGKSPGADCLMRDVLPEIERRMLADFPDRLRDWRAAAELDRAAEESWKAEVRTAQKAKKAPPLPPDALQTTEPQAPRLRQHDVTIERVATLLATTAPKGLLIVRDELAGWIEGMGSYNPAGRAFWVEAYGGRPYRVERQKHPEPIEIPRLAVAVYGGTQPDKLALLMREADDGLLGRMLWAWPEPIPFRLGHVAPGAQWAIRALDRLRELDLQPGDPPSPIMVPLTHDALALIETFGAEMQDRQSSAGGPLRSALGKARGQALRLALVLEMLWWCGKDGMAPPPAQIGPRAFAAAALLIGDYFMPMAERVYGDATATERERGAATLARWIIRERPNELHVRHLQREVRLPGLRTAEQIRAAADVLVEADWLRAPSAGRGVRAARADRLCRQSPAWGGGTMSRWAETFAALSGVSDTVDTLRQNGEPAFTVSHSVNSVTAAPEPAAAPPLSAAERALSTWSEAAEEERAAIVEHDGGIPRDWVEGFARLDAARAPADVPPKRWRRFVDDAGLFLDSPFCAVAAALGWGPFDLFGCDRDRPFARIDQAGLLWLLNGDRLVMIAENTVTIETPTGARQTWRRKPSAPRRVLAWELAP